MRVAIVVQRYGAEVIGGHESVARAIAQRLHASFNWPVEVFTTTAIDYQSWRHHYQPGTSEQEGVVVHRFVPRIKRHRWVFSGFNFLFKGWLNWFGKLRWLTALTGYLEHLWFILQGPYCPELCEEVVRRQGDFDRILFFTYLYYPTVYSILPLVDKAVFIPAAHPEAPLYFPTIRKIFAKVPRFLCGTPTEMELIRPLAGSAAQFKVAGMGVDIPSRQGESGDKKQGYLLYLGRIGRAKGIDVLVDYYGRYRAQGQVRYDLVLVGEKDPDFELPSLPGLVYRGFLSEKDKVAVTANAAIIVNPSPLDSLSLIVLEALAQGKPVLVNKHNPVLFAYTKELDSVLGYGNFNDFAAALRVIERGGLEAAIEKGREFVAREYSWDKVLGAYRDMIL